MLKNTNEMYGNVAKFLHWLIFILLFFMIILGFFLGDIPKDYQFFAYNMHKLTGLTILVLMILRGLWALINIKPALPSDTLPWQRSLERSVHLLLYFTVLAMPIAGWVGSAAAGRPPRIGSLALNLPIAPNKALVETSFQIHYLLAILLITLFCVHVGAALYHHYIRKDQILHRMLP